MSPRQFRLAVKTCIQVTSPPYPLSEKDPLLVSLLLELISLKSTHASSDPIPPSPGRQNADSGQPALSAQSTMVLALIDSLPVLWPDSLLDCWLTETAAAMNNIQNEDLRDFCRTRFWDAINGGEMDVARAAVCVTWWTTRGGREMVAGGRNHPKSADIGPFMSGALQDMAKL